MTLDGRFALAVLAVALAGLAAGELTQPQAYQLAPQSRPDIVAGRQRLMSPPAAGLASMVGIITARPLLRPDRRPVAHVSPHTGGLPRLSGILIDQGSRLALFAAASGKTAMHREGDRIGAYRIGRISAGTVVLTAPGAHIVLVPRFAPFGGTPGMDAAPPPRLGLEPVQVPSKE